MTLWPCGPGLGHVAQPSLAAGGTWLWPSVELAMSPTLSMGPNELSDAVVLCPVSSEKSRLA